MDFITIFPEICDFYFKHSLLKKAQDKKKIIFKAHNLRDFSFDKHSTVDDKPFGGGRGMVLKAEPLYRAIKALGAFSKRRRAPSRKRKVILLSPRGKKFSQQMATKWAKQDQLIFICGRYEGVDERVAKYLADEVVSLGDFVLMAGELPAIIMVEAVARLLPGVVGHSEDLIAERITKQGGFIEYPQYTRPEVVEINGKKRKVPKVLMSGHHKEIEKWRAANSKVIE